jgi:hypothetical protein
MLYDKGAEDELNFLKRVNGPGVVTQAYNPRYSGSGDWENCGSRLAHAKNLQ